MDTYIYKKWTGNLRIFVTKIHPLVSKLESSTTVQIPVYTVKFNNNYSNIHINMVCICPRAASAETKQGTAKIPGTRWSVM